ncbi:MAG: hypothetical protein EOP83_11800 [Verrucomicrobiaceae bacterium]|nr:MAG: hypothetical protein EOP83_11800 [Verrucomicrobiaceae bacterium]
MAYLTQISREHDLATLRAMEARKGMGDVVFIPVVIPRPMHHAFVLPTEIQDWIYQRYKGEDVYYQFVGKIDHATMRPDLTTVFFFTDPEFAFEFKMRWC